MPKPSGNSGNSTTQTSGPPPQVLSNYQNLVGQANSLATKPLSQYSGPLVAGFVPQQQEGFQQVQNASGIQTPYINAAAQEFGNATTPFYDTVSNYESPYTSAVTNSLQNLYDQQNKQQQEQVQGSAVEHGAYGGDRMAVSQALTAGNEALNESPTLANVLQGGYQTALGASEAQGWLGEQGGFWIGGLGTGAENTALAGGNAKVRSGTLQQQLAQEQVNIPYEQFVASQSFPYQNLGMLAPIVEGTGSLSGGTGTTTYPPPSTLGQIAGLGVAGLGAVGLTGGFGSNVYVSNLFNGGGGSSYAGGFGSSYGGSPATDAAALTGKSGGRIGYAPGG